MQFGDAPRVLSYFKEHCKENSDFYFQYDVDQDNHLRKVFWADAQSQLDCECFGDVLAFDSTYCTNAYRKPLIMLAGVITFLQ